jgi:pimeloyl-ACP methyl ester carboxylesterase
MPGAGHVSPVEAPDLFNREVRDFLRRDVEASAHPAT